MRSVGACLGILLVAMCGCSRAPSPAQVASSANAAQFKPPQFAERDYQERAGFQLCLLGIDCLALDDRPFRVCLAAAEHCPPDAEIYRVPSGSELPSNNALEQTRKR